jgi:hypothetical protein
MLKTIGLLIAVSVLLAGCEPPMSHVARDGQPCHQISSIPWEPIWVTPDNQTACLQ